MMAKGQKGIYVTEKEYALIAEAKGLFQAFTDTRRMSWGVFLCAVAFGSLAAEALAGFQRRCPNCGDEVEFTLIHPKLKRRRSLVPRSPKQPQRPE
jgi:hypothetical protein